MIKPRTFEQELSTLINKHSLENDSNTPDFILAEYMKDCLAAFNKASSSRSMFNHTDTKIYSGFGRLPLSNGKQSEPVAMEMYVTGTMDNESERST